MHGSVVILFSRVLHELVLRCVTTTTSRPIEVCEKDITGRICMPVGDDHSLSPASQGIRTSISADICGPDKHVLYVGTRFR